MDDKRVAHYALSFLGGTPTVNRYYNEDKSKAIDIMVSRQGFCKGVTACATIGLNKVDIGLTSKGKKLRVELVAAALPNEPCLENILSTAAFEVMDAGRCAYGTVIPNVVSSYIPGGELRHLLLLSPAYWAQYSALTEGDETVAWLLLVPISDGEADYVRKYGADAFDLFLGEKGVDVLDLHRRPVL